MNTDIELLLDFTQTRTEEDPLGTPDGLRAWLRQQDLIGEGDPVTDNDVRRVRHFRAAAVGLMRERVGWAADPRTRPALATVPLRITIGEGGTMGMEPEGSGVDGALSMLMAALYRVSLSGELERLKACKGCGFAFYDESKNRSRIWCDMARCGAQDKARAYRRRKSGER